MPHSIGHKRETRQRIVFAARTLFAARGYDATSIEEIMRECGLTRGGFYAHFKSKGHLYREAHMQATAIDAFPVGDIETSARFAFLAADVASTEPEVRAAYTSAFRSMSESSSLTVAAMIVGALAVAKTIDDPELTSKLLAACRENVDALLHGAGIYSSPAFFWEPTVT